MITKQQVIKSVMKSSTWVKRNGDYWVYLFIVCYILLNLEINCVFYHFLCFVFVLNIIYYIDYEKET